MHVARAALLLVLIQAIRSVFCGVVIAVAVVLAKAISTNRREPRLKILAMIQIDTTETENRKV